MQKPIDRITAEELENMLDRAPLSEGEPEKINAEDPTSKYELADEDLEDVSGSLPNVKSVCKQIADKHCIRVNDSAGYKGPN